MAELEKVIYSIERCICHVPDACRDCAYDSGHPYNECVEMMLNDALTLLKAQDETRLIYFTPDQTYMQTFGFIVKNAVKKWIINGDRSIAPAVGGR